VSEPVRSAAPQAAATSASPQATATNVSPTAAKPVSPPKPAPTDAADEDLLEFLGSLDDADAEDAGEWLEFLARADLDKVARARRSAPPQPAAAKK
jgi:hypothetical protein